MTDRQLIVKEIAERIATVIPDVDLSGLTEESVLSQYAGFDSLQVLETLVWLEDRFDIAIPDEELVAHHFDTVGKMADYVTARTA